MKESDEAQPRKASCLLHLLLHLRSMEGKHGLSGFRKPLIYRRI